MARLIHILNRDGSLKTSADKGKQVIEDDAQERKAMIHLVSMFSIFLGMILFFVWVAFYVEEDSEVTPPQEQTFYKNCMEDGHTRTQCNVMGKEYFSWTWKMKE
jgi:chloramphenicol 3-O-phosphotransferase